MKRWLILTLILILNYIPNVALAEYEGADPSIYSMVNPVPISEENITSPFGWRTHPISGVQKFHSGIDIGVDYGTPVHAAATGRVTCAGWVSGYGNYVVIDHGGGVETCYGHNQELYVTEGMMVSQSDVIAGAGSTGNSTGPHVHFEVRVNGEPQDPAWWLKGIPAGDGSPGGPMMDNDIEALNFDAQYNFIQPITDAIKACAEACTKGLKIIKDKLKWLFFVLLTIDLALTSMGRVMGVNETDMEGYFRWLLGKLLLYGFLTFMFLNWGDLVANTIRNYFVTMSGLSMNQSEEVIGKLVTDPTEIVQIGTSYAEPILHYLQTISGPQMMMQLPTVILCCIAAATILICFFLIGIELALTYIEFYCSALFGFISFSFVGFERTRKYAGNAINGVFVCALKLMVFSVIALILTGALKESVPEDYFDQKTTTISASGGNFANVDQFAEAIKQVETGGCEDPYHTYSEDGYGYGAYQISFTNWESWCAEAGVDPAPPMPWPADVQDIVAKHKMTVLYEQYGNWHDVAIVWNAGHVVDWDEGYWMKVCNASGNTVTKTINIIILLKLMLVSLAAMIFGHADCKTIMREFGNSRFRFRHTG